MNILVVNDDSIHSPGLALLAREAAKLGRVWVVAPASQCSAMSHRLSINAALRVERAADFPAPVEEAWSVSGTPADCVKVALHYILKERPDYVFSGINDGYNVGFDIAYSGTLGAAMEAVMNGIPAIAFSTAMRYSLDLPQAYLADIARELMEKPLGPGKVWNVNFPEVTPGALRGIARDVSIANVQMYNEDYAEEVQADGSVILTGQSAPLGPDAEVPEGSDIDALRNGHISIGWIKSAVM